MINHARVIRFPLRALPLRVSQKESRCSQLSFLGQHPRMKVYAHSFQISNALPLRTSVKRRNSKTNTTLFVRRWSCAPFLVLRVSRRSPLGFLHLITFDRSTAFSLLYSHLYSLIGPSPSLSSPFPLATSTATPLTSRSNQENCGQSRRTLGQTFLKRHKKHNNKDTLRRTRSKHL